MKFFSRSGNNALYIILEGIAFAVVLNLFSPFVQLFAKHMGAGDIYIALINSLPPLVAVLVLIPCSILIEKVNRKKSTTGLMILINSLFYALIAFVPFIPNQVKVLVYVLLIGLMNWPGSLYLTTWQSFFADTFSGSDANRVYSLRSMYSAFFGMVTVLLTGLVLTEIPRTEGQRVVIYQFFYLACFLISLLQLFFLSKVRQQDAGSSAREGNIPVVLFKLAEFKEIFRNRSFMIFCLCTFLFHVAWQMGWPLFFLYNADYAKLNELQFGLINVAAGFASFLSFSAWNRLIEKKGSKFVITLGALGLAVTPLFYIVLVSFYKIFIFNVFAGFAGACFTLTLFCSLLETLPENKKTIYISFFNTLINISGFISPLIGIWLYRQVGIFTAFLIIGILRLLASSFYIVRWWTGRKLNKPVLKENNILEG